MNAHTIHDPSLLDVSPALETGSLTSLSTHWMPLRELIAHWTDVDTVQLPAPVAPLLTAIGHALFALSRETRTLQERLWALTAEVLAEVQVWRAQQQEEVSAS